MSDETGPGWPSRLPPPLLGAAYMLLAGLSGSAMAGGIRYLTDAGFPALEAAFFRNLFGFIALAPILLRQGLVPFRTKRLGLHALRAALNAACMLMFFVAVSITPLAKVQSLNFTTPLFATLLAAVLLHETVGRSRWIAIGIGVLGAAVILRPGIDALDAGALLVLTASLVWAFVIMVIKVLARTDSPITITCYSVSFLTLFSFVPAALVWQWPQGEQWLWLVFLGLMGTVTHLGFAQAFKLSDASAVMPLDFVRLLWAAAIGYVFFAEIPSLWTWLGAAMIVAGSFYLARREAWAKPTASGPDAR